MILEQQIFANKNKHSSQISTPTQYMDLK